MNKLNFAFKILWVLAIALFLFIVYIITVSSWNEVKSLLVPLGVLISAMLASISVMKSIENTNLLEEEKIKRELFDRRKNVVSLFIEIYSLIEYENSETPNTPINMDMELMQRCTQILPETKYIFNEKDFLAIKPLVEKIFSLMKLISSVKKIQDITLKNENLNKASKVQQELRESLLIKIKLIEESMQLIK